MSQKVELLIESIKNDENLSSESTHKLGLILEEYTKINSAFQSLQNGAGFFIDTTDPGIKK